MPVIRQQPTIQRQISKARHRLWLKLWLEIACRVLAWAAVTMAVVVLVARLGGWSLPWVWLGGGVTGIAALVTVIWSARCKPSEAVAAAALDEAVGLRERVSTSLYCATSDDPFARAVLADAEARAGILTVSQHMRLEWPTSARRAGGAIVLLAAMFLVPEGLLARAEAKTRAAREVEVTRARVEVKKRLSEMKKIAATNPALAELKTELDKLDVQAANRMMQPGDIRHEALKKIDKLADVVREKQKSDKFDRLNETKKMLRTLKQPTGGKTPVQKLTQKLAQGDFKGAKETMRDIKEQLATLKQDSDKKFVKKMTKQLEQLANQMDKLANQEQLKKKLEQAGIKKEDVERMLEHLNKKDLEQMRKQLEKNGLSQKQIEKITSQVKKQQGASKAMQQMSGAMKSAAQAAGDGQMGDAMGELESAGEQLSEMEMLEQEMNQLQSTMSGLQEAKNTCNGQGRGKDGDEGLGQGTGQGSGLGGRGKGQGGLAPSSPTDVAFKTERDKVKTTKGKIVGQFLVDGEQIKGEADDAFVELIEAAEREATDTINRDRIPRQYHKAMKEYFDRLPGDLSVEPKTSSTNDEDEKEEQPADNAKGKDQAKD